MAAALTRLTGKTWTAFRGQFDWGWNYRCEDGREVITQEQVEPSK